MRIQGDNIYLKMLERKDCKTLWNDYEYDFKNPTEEFNIGHSDEKSEKWFDEIQNLQGNTNVRLGIFLANDIVIGDIALQDIDRINRNCSIGIGIAKIVNRSKGYGGEAVRLMLDYGFTYLGMERILVDNGSYQLIVKRADILPSAAETAAKDAVPVCNPSFRFAMADFLEETRWHVDDPEREENIKTKNERMMKELKKARFLVPMKYEGGALKRGENHISLSKGGSMTFPKVQNNKGTYFLPLFTDWPTGKRSGAPRYLPSTMASTWQEKTESSSIR